MHERYAIPFRKVILLINFNQLKLKFIKLYPDIPVLLEYNEPYYRIRVGNCRTKLEAIKIKRQISKKFPGAYPVPEIINFSQLKK